MTALRRNPYVVISWGAGYGSQHDDAESRFHALKADTDHYSPRLVFAAIDEKTKMYTCYFLRDGVLWRGTTLTEPKHHIMSIVQAIEYGSSNTHPWRMEIQPQNPNVLWQVDPSESQ
jgi:hypothetical protein